MSIIITRENTTPTEFERHFSATRHTRRDVLLEMREAGNAVTDAEFVRAAILDRDEAEDRRRYWDDLLSVGHVRMPDADQVGAE